MLLLYCLGGHCVLTLSPGARIWLSLSRSFPLCPLYLLISYYPPIPIQPPRVKENLFATRQKEMLISSLFCFAAAVVMRGELL